MPKTLATLFLTFLLAPLAAAQGDRPALEHYNLGKKGLAIEGYDPVSYFKEGGGKPEKGKDSITTDYRGVTYRFASEKHRELFKLAPERYEPAYGGWCAWAMSKDKPEKVEIDPKSFLIEEGRLLLFFDGFFADTRKQWLKAGGLTQRPRADAYWMKVTGEKPVRDVLHWNLDQGLALRGFDPTAYRQGKALAGKVDLVAVHDGVTYRFADEDARKTFLADPGSFEPAYGGWCATAMASGKQVDADPQAFLVDGKRLYVFSNAAARDTFQADRAKQTAAADKAWEGILSKRSS